MITLHSKRTGGQYSSNQGFIQLDFVALLATLSLIIVIRESCVWVMTQFHHAELGNLCGLFLLLIGLLIYKHTWGLPARMLAANGVIMKESALAFLPIAAGSGVMLQKLGPELFSFMLILTLSTLLPLWGYGKLAKRWLK